MRTSLANKKYIAATKAYDSGRVERAEALYRQALLLDRCHVPSYQMLGLLLSQTRRQQEALDLLRSAVESSPGQVHHLLNLAMVLWAQGKVDEFLSTVRKAVDLRPDLAESHINLGHGLRKSGDYVGAVAAYRRADLLEPDKPELQNDLGVALAESGRMDESISHLRAATTRWPACPELQNNLGNALRETGRSEEAISCYDRALELRSNYPEANNNRGAALQDLCDLDGAISAYHQALRLRPQYAAAKYNLATAMLTIGEFSDAWQYYEARWEATPTPRRWTCSQPLWDGRPLKDSTILLHTEQGYGDSIQFVRFAEDVVARVGKVLLLCGVSLKRLFLSVKGTAGVFTEGDELPPFDCHCPLLTLPKIFGVTLATIPRSIPYLAPQAPDIGRWRTRLGCRSDKMRVGLAWAGRQWPYHNRKRSIGLAALAPILSVPGIECFSLQFGAGSEQTAEYSSREGLIDLTDEHRDFADTAALVSQLDLVITCDTAVAHLAGALAIPVWVALPYAADWRWLLIREDSPWYPTMRLFRQKKPNDWSAPVAEIKAAIVAILSSKAKSDVMPGITSTASPAELGVGSYTFLNTERKRPCSGC